MIESIPTKIPQISIREGLAVTTSLAIAEFFNKQHKDVLRKIDLLDSSPEFNRRNFAPVEYTDAKGEKRPAYEITKNGFVFLVMGFTGKKAAAFKEAYIAEFDRMEAGLSQRTPPAFIPQRFMLTLVSHQWHCDPLPEKSFIAEPATLAGRIEQELYLFSQQQLTKIMFTCAKHVDLAALEK